MGYKTREPILMYGGPRRACRQLASVCSESRQRWANSLLVKYKVSFMVCTLPLEWIVSQGLLKYLDLLLINDWIGSCGVPLDLLVKVRNHVN